MMIDMISVEGGTFLLGDKVPVTLSDFQIGKYPVTQAQWREIMGNNPSYFKGDDLPVESVSWDDIQEFLEKLNAKNPGKNYRLPTEAEWEYAARGGNQSNDYLYSGGNDIGAVAWYANNAQSTHPVGLKKANELGLYDMSGNVWEWCEDDWHGSYQGAPTDGRAWVDSPRGSGRVIRGGCWEFNAELCRAAYRLSLTPTRCLNYVGFRLAI